MIEANSASDFELLGAAIYTFVKKVLRAEITMMMELFLVSEAKKLIILEIQTTAFWFRLRP